MFRTLVKTDTMAIDEHTGLESMYESEEEPAVYDQDDQ